jgi:hypothetical protein
MFKSFFDETGKTVSDKVSVVAGFAGSEAECDRVAAEWSKIVAPIKEFHALEFFPRNPDGTLTGNYKGIPVAEAEGVVRKLIEILAGSQLESIGMALNAEAFGQLTEDERRYLTSAVLYAKDWPEQGAPNKPHVACLHYCITQANGYTPEGEKMQITFDQQIKPEATTTIRIYNQLKALGGKWGGRLADSLLHSSRKKAVLLQAADLLTYVIAWSLKDAGIRNEIGNLAATKLAYEKEYVRSMDTKSLDHHLKSCPFRTTFWKDLADPDLIEQIRAQGVEVLLYRSAEGVYMTSHIRREKVSVVDELDPQPLPRGGLNRPTTREDSTKKIRES